MEELFDMPNGQIEEKLEADWEMAPTPTWPCRRKAKGEKLGEGPQAAQGPAQEDGTWRRSCKMPPSPNQVDEYTTFMVQVSLG